MREHTPADAAFIEQLWKRKAQQGSMFAHAELIEDFSRSPSTNEGPPSIPAGTTVLVTMISRFGHVCFRSTDIDRIEHGYTAGIAPEKLCNYRWARQKKPR